MKPFPSCRTCGVSTESRHRVYCRKCSPCNRRVAQHVWTPEIDEAIINAYKYEYSNKPVARLAARFQIGRAAIIHRARKLGVTRRAKDIQWPMKAVDILRVNAHLTIKGISQKLQEAGFYYGWATIRDKMSRICLKGSSLHYSINETAKILGVSHHRIRRWLAAGNLTALRTGGERNDAIITVKEIKRFIFNYPSEINPTYCDFLLILDIVTNGQAGRGTALGTRGAKHEGD